MTDTTALRAARDALSLMQSLYECDLKETASGVVLAAQTSDAVPWDKFASYLIDKHEGDVVSEEMLQRAVSEMLLDPKYVGQRASIDELRQRMKDANDLWDELGVTSSADMLALTADAQPVARSAPSLLREPVKSIAEVSAQIPGGCYCPPGKCFAPVIMGKQTPCLRRNDAAAQPPASQDDARDAARLDWIERTLFSKHWNGVDDSGSEHYWRLVGYWRRIVEAMRGDNLRAAIDRAISASTAKDRT
jgi:hypothetical protein